MISFIISAFNRPNALRTCLSSLVQQTMPEWEAIVCDNSDGRASQVEHLRLCGMDCRITYLATGESTEVEGAMHKFCLYTAAEIGVRKSRGDWLCFPNDDSYYCPWFAERMIAHAEKHELELAYCDIIAGGRGGHWLLQAEPKLCQIDKTNWIVRREWFKGWADHTGAGYADADGRTIVELVKRGVRHGRLSEVLVVHN